MTAPLCPTHQTPMRAGKYPGQYFCPRPGDGPTGYCTQRMRVSGRGETGNVAAAVFDAVKAVASRNNAEADAGSRVMASYSNDARMKSALEFVGRIFQGRGPESIPEALEAVRLAMGMFDS